MLLVLANPCKVVAMQFVGLVRSESLGHFLELLASVLRVYFLLSL